MIEDQGRFLGAEIVKNPILRVEEVRLNPEEMEQVGGILANAGCLVVERGFTIQERFAERFGLDGRCIPPKSEIELDNIDEFLSTRIAWFDWRSVITRLRNVFRGSNVVEYPHAGVTRSRDN